MRARIWVVVTVMGLLAACASADTAVVEAVPPQDAAARLAADPAPVLLDIRTPDEFASGRIAGATNVDFYAADFTARLAELDRDADYVIYCRSGNRTTSALDIFRDLGFTSVRSVDGGILAWAAAGLPVEP